MTQEPRRLNMRKYLDILKKGNSVGSVLLTILVASSLRILGPLAMNGLKNVLGAAGTNQFNSLIIVQVIIMSSIIITSFPVRSEPKNSWAIIGLRPSTILL